jgi:hypothetical protein
MSDFREVRLWGESNTVTGGEINDDQNNAKALHTINAQSAVYDSFALAVTPAANELGVTPAALIDALKTLATPAGPIE